MIEIRPFKESDLNFVYHSWLKTCRPDFKALRSDSYYSTYKREVESLIDKSMIRVAFDPFDENHILGYIVFQLVDDILVIHHAYVKSSFRRFGIFKDLIKSVFPTLGIEPIFITYKNERISKMGDKYKFVFKPELRGL